MARAAVSSSGALPLLVWPEQTEIAALLSRRAELVRRIALLPRFSHRRVVLEANLRGLTEQVLSLEARLRKSIEP